jgi:hypothetical protein
MRELDFDLADDVASVDGDETKTHAADNTRHHAESCERRRDREGS